MRTYACIHKDNGIYTHKCAHKHICVHIYNHACKHKMSRRCVHNQTTCTLENLRTATKTCTHTQILAYINARINKYMQTCLDIR